MIHVTVALPDEVAQHYYAASEKLAAYLQSPPPTPQTLMRLMLAGFHADDIVGHFDRVLRNISGAPMPDETDTYVFSPEFDDAP